MDRGREKTLGTAEGGERSANPAFLALSQREILSFVPPFPLFFAIFFSPSNGAGGGKENVALSSSSSSSLSEAAAAAAGGDTSRID